MIYTAGNTQAVQGELTGASNADMRYDAGEITAVRSMLGTPDDPNMKYGCGPKNAIKTLKLALSGAVDDPTTPDVSSAIYANLPAQNKMWGTQKLEAVKAVITTSSTLSVEVNAIATDDGRVIVSPAAYYTDKGILREFNQAFDLFFDDNGYLKIITDKEYFIYIDAGKTQKIRVTGIQIDSAATPRLKLFATPSSSEARFAFEIINSSGQVVNKLSFSPHGASKPSLKIVTTTPMYNKTLSTSSALAYLVQLNKNPYNFVIENNQLVCVWGSNQFPLYFDKVTNSSQNHTQPVTCDFIKVVS